MLIIKNTPPERTYPKLDYIKLRNKKIKYKCKWQTCDFQLNKKLVKLNEDGQLYWMNALRQK